VKMYENPVTQANIARLRELRYEVVEPAYGDLACGYQGKGRLPEEDSLIGIIERDVDMPLKGQRYIVTAGGTIEKIDPVRYLSNFSSGKMGSELARALYRKGAEVLLVYGNVSIKTPSYMDGIQAKTTEAMLKTLEDNIGKFDGLFMAAAPADFKPEYSKSKLKKTDDKETYELKMNKNPDILKTLRAKHADKFLVGFALETGDFIEYAKNKIKDKSLDYIVMNPLSDAFNPLENDRNTVILIGKDGGIQELKDKPKREVADWLVDVTLLGDLPGKKK
jgi:phosphopantothenoylcysteine decarboxylase / phosphopantothenate---cysteine ligase